MNPLGKKLNELRVNGRDGTCRMLYFAARGRRFVMVHGFQKRMADYLSTDPAPEMSASAPAPPRHHPSWREVRDTFLAEPEVQEAYHQLAPRYAVVRELIAFREQRGWSQRELADRAGMKQPQLAR